MKKLTIVVLALLLSVVVSGCSSSTEDIQTDNSVQELKNQSGIEESNVQSAEIAKEDAIQTESSAEQVTDDVAKEQTAMKSSKDDRMVIYTANISILVKSYQDTLNLVQQQLLSMNGYIVESNSYAAGEGNALEGTITVRIPQSKFASFLQSVEKGSTKIIDRSISGQDVTEEYVDLESRLKSKQVVENRLLEFIEKAEKTEELLKVSKDLAAVQEEIEQLKGKMNYINNKVDLATVTINVMEDKVNVPALENENLNTWEKTKQQFMGSVNFLLHACSALIIFFVGSLPVLIVLGVLLLVIIYFLRKRNKHKQG